MISDPLLICNHLQAETAQDQWLLTIWCKRKNKTTVSIRKRLSVSHLVIHEAASFEASQPSYFGQVLGI